MTKRSLAEHLDPELKPKRILALDGGGLRGVLTLAFLQEIEDILRAQSGAGAEFRLSDYYDLIGGTSTGAIIAAGLALGMSVKEVRDHYFRIGAEVFTRKVYGDGKFAQRYDADRLASALKSIFGTRTLGADDFKTGLIVLCKRLDTGSQWTLSNNPRDRYFNAPAQSHTVPNKDYPLWSVIRASTAAPTYFEAERITIKAADTQAGLRAVDGEFVDGGVSPANNPALQLVLAATVKGHGFDWQMGEDKLHVTSVGTGQASQELGLSTGLPIAGKRAVKALMSVLDDCQDMVEVIMQWLSNSPTARPIDRVIGKLEGSYAGTGPSLRYHRYNVRFEEQWFREHLDWQARDKILEDLAQMDKPANLPTLEKIGQEAARRFVRPEHFTMS